MLDFAARARTAFYLHLANEQMLELRQTIVQALNASLDVARRLNEAGNITDLDLARERALAEAGKLALRSCGNRGAPKPGAVERSNGALGKNYRVAS